MTFLGAAPGAQAAVAIFGAPIDATSTFRPGSRLAPAAIRRASQSIETYSPVLGRDLTNVSYADLGDVDVTGSQLDGALAHVRDIVSALAASTLPLLLGGEHTVTLAAVEALALRHQELAVIQCDAHTDLRDEYEGRRVSHATVIRRIAEITGDRVVQLGVRAGTREEFEFAESHLRFTSSGIAIPSEVWTWLAARPVYVTVDIDVIDPADAPGTGNPEPEGLTVRDLLGFIRRLGQLNVVGLDVVEVSPPYDPSGRTAVLAATIVREAILSVAGGRSSSAPGGGHRRTGTG